MEKLHLCMIQNIFFLNVICTKLISNSCGKFRESSIGDAVSYKTKKDNNRIN